jgi:hypothetical protein
MHIILSLVHGEYNKFSCHNEPFQGPATIDGIGVQGHYFEFRSHVDATRGTHVHRDDYEKCDGSL